MHVLMHVLMHVYLLLCVLAGFDVVVISSLLIVDYNTHQRALAHLHTTTTNHPAPTAAFDGFEGGKKSKKGSFVDDTNGLDEKLFIPPWNINEYHGDTVLPFNAQEGYEEEQQGSDERMIPPHFKKIIKVVGWGWGWVYQGRGMGGGWGM